MSQGTKVELEMYDTQSVPCPPCEKRAGALEIHSLWLTLCSDQDPGSPSKLISIC